jgi:urocanate hydratase
VPLDGLAVGVVLSGGTPPCGYVAQRDRHEPDVTAIVAPVSWRGGVAGALSLLGPTYRISEETMQRFGRVVSAEARLVSEQFGDSAATSDPAATGGPR